MHSSDTIFVSGIRPGEAGQIIALLAACGLVTDDLSPAMLKNFLVARSGGDICGVVGLEIRGGDALLRSLGVAKTHRTRGIGRKLVQSAERYARSRHVQTLYLLTLTAQGFFEKAGYSVIERASAPQAMQATGEFKCLCPDAAVCMRKDLGHGL